MQHVTIALAIVGLGVLTACRSNSAFEAEADTQPFCEALAAALRRLNRTQNPLR